MDKKSNKCKNSNSFNAEIGKRLKKIKNENDFSQENMADILGVSHAYYGKVERGLHCLSVEKLCILNQELGVDLNYLITGKETAPNKHLDEFFETCPPEYKAEITAILSNIVKLVISKK